MRRLCFCVLLVSITCRLRWGTEIWHVFCLLQRHSYHLKKKKVIFFSIQCLPGCSWNSQTDRVKWQHHHLHPDTGWTAWWVWQQTAARSGRWAFTTLCTAITAGLGLYWRKSGLYQKRQKYDLLSEADLCSSATREMFLWHDMIRPSLNAINAHVNTIWSYSKFVKLWTSTVIGL